MPVVHQSGHVLAIQNWCPSGQGEMEIIEPEIILDLLWVLLLPSLLKHCCAKNILGTIPVRQSPRSRSLQLFCAFWYPSTGPSNALNSEECFPETNL